MEASRTRMAERDARLEEAPVLTDLVIITGFSGAGKSTAMAAFEDEGYFCVDNLPSEMIRSLVELFMHAGSKVARAAVVSDVRAGSYFEGLSAMLDSLRAAGVNHRVLFLEADEQTLLTRYKETRRRHPLAPTGSVADGIARERALLAPLRARADVVIDTTGLTAAMLRRKLADELLPTRTPGRLAITFQSFGFKWGPARDPDLLLDVRFLPNPHYEPQLRPLTGEDPRIVEFIDQAGELEAFYDRLEPFLDYLLPQYLNEGKAHLVVAIGCTGGRHRSVAIAEHLAKRYRHSEAFLVEVVHRDVSRPA
ncbi:MAG: RNase adapter RapZ, partial [Solirubrobacterales bacterium]|nr:RNase adapter RapZ [Solirubrobacterales bacterium]MBV9714725.1 RNase adapter RapZ [Solirubrobacterales bacterium]